MYVAHFCLSVCAPFFYCFIMDHVVWNKRVDWLIEKTNATAPKRIDGVLSDEAEIDFEFVEDCLALKMTFSSGHSDPRIVHLFLCRPGMIFGIKAPSLLIGRMTNAFLNGN